MLNNESRLLLVKAYKEMPDVEKVAKMFSISTSSVYRIVRQMNQTGSVELKTHTRGRKPVLTPEDIENIRRTVEAEPNITIRALREKLNLRVSDETVRTKVLSLGLRPRKRRIFSRIQHPENEWNTDNLAPGAESSESGAESGEPGTDNTQTTGQSTNA